ncbi:MAG: signal recognition particle protein Srp19 [Candidatus Syntropharchaeales archaeon]
MSKKETVIWPTYLDKKVSRSGGRRIPRKISVKSPKLEEIAKALRKLGIEPMIEKEKAYPRRWWGEKGRILIEKPESKEKLLREVATKIREMRGV